MCHVYLDSQSAKCNENDSLIFLVRRAVRGIDETATDDNVVAMAVSTLEKRFKESQGEGVVGAPAAALMADRETEVDFPRDIHPCKSGESVFFFQMK